MVLNLEHDVLHRKDFTTFTCGQTDMLARLTLQIYFSGYNSLSWRSGLAEIFPIHGIILTPPTSFKRKHVNKVGLGKSVYKCKRLYRVCAAAAADQIESESTGVRDN